MIKITKFFYIHGLVFLLAAVTFFTGSMTTFGITYGVVLIHELCHLFTALLLGVKVYSVILMPFGMTLRLTPHLVRMPKKEILIALAGPFSNAVMLTFGLVMVPPQSRNLNVWIFLIANVAVMVLNMMPVPPLDGGRVVRALIIRQCGLIPAAKYVRRISYAIIGILGVFAVGVLVLSHGNVSLVVICAFLLYHVTEEKKNNELLFMRTLLYEKEKLCRENIIPNRQLLVHKDMPAKQILRRLNFDTFHIIMVLDNRLSVCATITERDVIRAVTRKGYGIRAKDVCMLAAESE